MTSEPISASAKMAKEAYLSREKCTCTMMSDGQFKDYKIDPHCRLHGSDEIPDRDPISVQERFEKLHAELQKGKKMIPGQEDNMIRVSISHKFRKKDEVAWISIPFSREEVLKDDPIIGEIKVKVITLVEEIKKNFDDAMDLAEPLIVHTPEKNAVSPVIASAPANAAPASGDDEMCPKCQSKMKWITKPRKKGGGTWSAWSCPNTHPSIDESQRCTQELIFPSK